MGMVDSSLGSLHSDGHIGDDDFHFSLNQIGNQLTQPVVVAIGRSPVDDYVRSRRVARVA
jgi:hypothetical protein